MEVNMSNACKLSEWVGKWESNEFNRSVDSMIDAGWWDWFCKDSSLYNRTKKLVPLIKVLSGSPLINQEKVYISFKNNCPLIGTTYDSIAVIDKKTDDVLYWMTAKSGHSGQAELFAKPNFDDGDQLLKEGANLTDLKNYFK
jgi:hypothetical protein